MTLDVKWTVPFQVAFSLRHSFLVVAKLSRPTSLITVKSTPNSLITVKSTPILSQQLKVVPLHKVLSWCEALRFILGYDIWGGVATSLSRRLSFTGNSQESLKIAWYLILCDSIDLIALPTWKNLFVFFNTRLFCVLNLNEGIGCQALGHHASCSHDITKEKTIGLFWFLYSFIYMTAPPSPQSSDTLGNVP